MKPHEDWVYGSWTVDCVCGVNFDDGKEMVNCDECGVWVHTWCSRYVKGDDLFACHKCKIKNNDTQVSAAKLLVSETLTKEKTLSTQGHTVQMNRGFGACTEIPIEERVHVQGAPGGDLALFEGFSSVFSPQLWKCCGYVPKKFRLRYSEFPCWDDQEDGCDVAAPANDVVGNNGVKDRRRSFGCRETVMRRFQNDDIKKEKSFLCPLSTNKWRKEDCEDGVKKKVKVAAKEEEDYKNDLVGKTRKML